jgi:hypothetical protein
LPKQLAGYCHGIAVVEVGIKDVLH